MIIPAGATPSKRRISEDLFDELSAINRKLEERRDAYHEIESDPDYTIKERENAIKAVTERINDSMSPHADKADKLMKRAIDEYQTPNKGTASREDILTTMNLLLAADGVLDIEGLENIINVIDNDSVALRTVFPIIQKTGLGRLFEDTKAGRILQKESELKEIINSVKDYYKSFVETVALTKREDTQLKRVTCIHYLIDNLKTAETTFDELRKLTA